MKDGLGEGDWVVITPAGQVIDLDIPADIGPATLMVRPVTDALKTTQESLITGSVDRENAWAVEAFALNRVVVDRLDTEELTPQSLYDTVVGWRLAWQMSELSAR